MTSSSEAESFRSKIKGAYPSTALLNADKASNWVSVSSSVHCNSSMKSKNSVTPGENKSAENNGCT